MERVHIFSNKRVIFINYIVNLYHYQIIIKYRFEDKLEDVLNQILDLTQDKGNKDLRLIIDHEPQSFV